MRVVKQKEDSVLRGDFYAVLGKRLNDVDFCNEIYPVFIKVQHRVGAAE